MKYTRPSFFLPVGQGISSAYTALDIEADAAAQAESQLIGLIFFLQTRCGLLPGAQCVGGFRPVPPLLEGDASVRCVCGEDDVVVKGLWLGLKPNRRSSAGRLQLCASATCNVV